MSGAYRMTLHVTHMYNNKHITHTYAFQSETSAFVGRARKKKKFRLAAYMQVIILSLLSKYAGGDPSPRVPALPACIITPGPLVPPYPPFVFGRKSTKAERRKEKKEKKHSLKVKER